MTEPLIPQALQALPLGENVEIESSRDSPTYTYHIDFEKNRVVGFCDRTKAMEQAIYMILMTDRFKYYIYSWNYGTEWDKLWGKSYPVFKSLSRRVISEALLEDERITELLNFQISQVDSQTAAISFIAETIFGNIPIRREVRLRG